MAVDMLSKMSFVLMLFMEAENQNALGKSTTIPCHIHYHDDDEGSTYQERERYDVFISTHWMGYEGCYFYSLYAETYKTEQLKYNSPGRCSLNCRASSYFGVKMNTCVCLEDLNWSNIIHSKNCNHPCSNQWTNATCGSKDNGYFDVYKHMKVFQPDPEDRDKLDRNCLVAKTIDDINVINVSYKAVSCSEQHTAVCISDGGGTTNFGNISKSDMKSIIECPLSGDQLLKIMDELPSNTFVWTSYIRFNVHIWTNTNKKYIIPHNNVDCQLEAVNKKTLRFFKFYLQCIGLECTVLDETDIYETTTINDQFQHVESQSESRNAEWTSKYKIDTTDDSFPFDNSVVTLNRGSFLEYLVSTSLAFGILIFTVFVIWMCRKVKETNKRKRNIFSARNKCILSQNQTSANGHDFVEYDEVNPDETIDTTCPQLKERTVKEENNDPDTHWNHSSVNQFAQHESIIIHGLPSNDNEYEHPYHTLEENRISSLHEYSSTKAEPDYENTKI